jgi:hypothetical protein
MLDGFKDKKEKKVEVLMGEVIEGETYQDGAPLTPQLVEVDKMREELQEDRSKEITIRTPQSPAVGKAINTDLLDIPKVCDQCYLMDKCPQYKPKHSCYYQNAVNINGPGDMLELVKMVLEIQGQRVLFGRVIEQMEGSYIDKNLSDEMKRLLEYMKMFKDLSAPQESGNGIEIKVKGQAATEVAKQGGGGILSQLFGGGQ